MSQSEFTGMLVVASVALITLISVFVKLSWSMSKTLTEISDTLKTIVKITDEHEKEIRILKDDSSEIKSDLRLIQQQCNFAHRIND